MSEFTTAPGTIVLDDLGLEIDTAKGVKVTTPFDEEPFSPKGTIVVQGKGGTDSIDASGGRFKYVLSGRGGADELIGGNKKDQLSGGKGGDSLDGGAGADIFTGGGGKDTFIFNNGDLPNKGVDVIKDFNKGNDDVISLDRALVNRKLAPGEVSRQDFVVVEKNNDKAAGDLKQALIYETSTGNVYYNSSRKDSDDTLLVNLENAPTDVSAKNFEIF